MVGYPGGKNGGSGSMIRLLRLDGVEILLNTNQISLVESTPATVITLLSGEKINVKNTEVDVVAKIKAARKGSEGENCDPNEPPEAGKAYKKFPRR
jgi:uncharacterized protein YlzI (FlbEa/FlbD family)